MRALLLCLLLVGCVPVPVYKVQRSARVPHPAVPLRTGEPLAGPVEVAFGASNVGDARKPQLSDPDAAIEVPTTQVRSELRIRLAKRGEVDAIYERGVESSITKLDPTQAPIESGTPSGFGMAFRYSAQSEDTPHFSLGIGFEIMSWQLPFVEYRNCVENCDGQPTKEIIHGTEGATSLAFSLTPTYRSGPFALFAGVYTRRHPTIVRKGSELGAQDYDTDVDSGPYNTIVHAGVEYRYRNVSVLASIHQDITDDPVSYGPSFGLGLAITLPELHASRAPFVPTPTPAPLAPGDPDAQPSSYPSW